MSTDPPADSSTIEVRGYVTDPKCVGYQILTNYESTYWRTLVGNDAWGLYEILRSFCHNGNRTCHPSIRLLAAMLSLKETRVLTGWMKTIKGKEYRYQGLIEILQQYELIIAEVQGEGVTMRYLFHVNLTPGLLSDKQLQQLPAILQTKHMELLARCQKEREELLAKRRPAKITEGSGKLPDPSGKLPKGSGNLPPEQHQINIIHRTTRNTRSKDNHNTGDPPSGVVVALSLFGISEKIAARLASRYSQERIAEKLAYVEFLLAAQPDKVQNPRGWLRRAIEEDYGPPDGFITPEERAQLDAEAVEQAQRASAAELQHQTFVAERQAQQKARLRQLQVRYGTTEADYQLWSEVLTLFKSSRPDLHGVYAQAQILRCTDEAVLLGFEQERALQQLEHPGTMKALKRQLKLIAKRPLEVETVFLSVAAMDYTGEDGAGTPLA